MRAHRWIYERQFGELRFDQVVRHLCNNRACVNPIHLQVGTRADNAADMVIMGRSIKGEDKPGAKLSEADVHEIRRLWFDELISRRELGKRFGVSDGLIGGIVNGRYWKHVPFQDRDRELRDARVIVKQLRLELGDIGK